MRIMAGLTRDLFNIRCLRIPFQYRLQDPTVLWSVEVESRDFVGPDHHMWIHCYYESFLDSLYLESEWYSIQTKLYCTSP